MQNKCQHENQPAKPATIEPEVPLPLYHRKLPENSALSRRSPSRHHPMDSNASSADLSIPERARVAQGRIAGHNAVLPVQSAATGPSSVRGVRQHEAKQ